jgi:pimeloyl-ACP methyl ester carboxylesterase
MENIWLTAEDGVRLHAWFFPAEEGSRERKQVWLLLHGNAGNITHRLFHARLLLETGCAVFMPDYRGYGRSEGSPSEQGTYLDAQTAYDWLERQGFEPGCIHVIGESLGGGVASELAMCRPVGGLVLLSTFTNIMDIGSELLPWFPVRWLGSIRYDTLGKLPCVGCPVLILHSPGDTLIGFHHAERNFAAAREPKRLVQLRGDHNELPACDGDSYRQALEEFVQAVSGKR